MWASCCYFHRNCFRLDCDTFLFTVPHPLPPTPASFPPPAVRCYPCLRHGNRRRKASKTHRSSASPTKTPRTRRPPEVEGQTPWRHPRVRQTSAATSPRNSRDGGKAPNPGRCPRGCPRAPISAHGKARSPSLPPRKLPIGLSADRTTIRLVTRRCYHSRDGRTPREHVEEKTQGGDRRPPGPYVPGQ